MAYAPGTLNTFATGGGGYRGFLVSLSGQEAFRAALNGWREGARVIGKARATFGSSLPYAYGIETGHHRRGTLARRAGGVWYIRDSTADGIAYLGRALPAFFAAPQMGGAERILSQFYQTLENKARDYESVANRSGALQASIRVKPAGAFGTRG